MFRAAMEKLRSMDDAFRRQLESTLAGHQAELLQLANEKQQQIVAANEKVMDNAQLCSSPCYPSARNDISLLGFFLSGKL